MTAALAPLPAPAVGASTGVVLRPYQRAAVDAVFDYARCRPGHALVVIPTGGGKSLVMGTIIAEALENYPAARALVLAHRKELLQQNARAVAQVLPLAPIGIYSAGLGQKDRVSPVIVGGIQSVGRDPYALGAFDLVLIDEAHLVPNEDDTYYRKTVDALRILNPHVRFVGLTATPYRLGTGLLHRGENALFSDIAYEAGVRDLIEQGYLCRLISRATLAKLDTSGVATRGGEWVPGQLERAVDKDDLTRRVAAEALRLCEGRRKILAFCAGVRHAEHVAEALRALGVAAQTVHGELTPFEREARLNAFRAGELRCLTSVDVLTTGFDEPSIDAILLLRPTKSTGLYVQMVGRGFRLHPGKTDTLVLDFAQNVARHGPVDAIEVDERTGTMGEGDAPTKECPECHELVAAGVRACAGCGHEFPPPVRAPILPEASGAPILSDEAGPSWWDDVTDVTYHHHTKRSDPDALPTLRVEYFNGWRHLASEWLCFEHTGFAREKAERWWRRRSSLPVPDTVDEALEQAAGLLRPTAIECRKEGKWVRVVGYRLPEPPADPAQMGLGFDSYSAAPAAAERRAGALPRACWSCGWWAWGACGKWNAKPPEDVQKIGCEAWTDDETVTAF